MNYELDLSTADQLVELQEIASTIRTAITGLNRKRTWRESELAMTHAKYVRALTAVNMAIDRLAALS